LEDDFENSKDILLLFQQTLPLSSQARSLAEFVKIGAYLGMSDFVLGFSCHRPIVSWKVMNHSYDFSLY
jgi:hypothetical protein